jgi:hypothetical protein
VVASTPLIAALVSRLVADATPRKTLSAVEDRLIAVLRDEFSRVRNTPLLLPMPRDSRLRVIAEGMFLQSHAAADLGKLASSAGIDPRNPTLRPEMRRISILSLSRRRAEVFVILTQSRSLDNGVNILVARIPSAIGSVTNSPGAVLICSESGDVPNDVGYPSG